MVVPLFLSLFPSASTTSSLHRTQPSLRHRETLRRNEAKREAGERRSPRKTSVSQRWRYWRASSSPSSPFVFWAASAAICSWDFWQRLEQSTVKARRANEPVATPGKVSVWKASFSKSYSSKRGWKVISRVKYRSSDMIYVRWRIAIEENISLLV